MDEPFYTSPGSTYEPGDIFSGVPFPALKYPLEFFRASPNRRGAQGAATLFPSTHPHQDGDTARGAFSKRTVILLSHGCELDSVDRDVERGKTSHDKRYWLAAPVLPLKACGPKIQEATAKGIHPNKFLLPPSGPFEEPQFADLRKITPITVPYFHDAQKLAGLSQTAVVALQAHLGLFFSRYVIYVQPIACPSCGETIDPKAFIAPTVEDADVD
jgi:hypothetical protein